MDDYSGETGEWQPTCTRPDDLVWAIQVGAKGIPGLSWRQANGPRYERVASGLYAPADRSRSVEQRIVDAAAPLEPDGSRGVITGWASLRWRGASYFDGIAPDGTERPVDTVSRTGIRRRDRPGVVHRTAWLPPEEREVVDGLPVATIQRSLFDEIHILDELWGSVIAIDMAAAAGLISVWLFATYVGECNSRNGAPLAREAVSLADDDSWSPREPWMRLVWELVANLPRPLVNRSLYDLRGRLLGIPDLFDPVAGVAGDYSGAIHRGRARHAKDVARTELFRSHGLETVEAVAGERRDVVARRILAARSRALFLPPEERLWTLQPPPWVVVPETLDAVLERRGLVADLTRI